MLKSPPADLEQSLGKHISSFCSASLGKLDDRNHCAHFVSHLMEYELPGTATCKTFTYDDKMNVKKGGTIRVNEIFNKLSKTGKLENKPAQVLTCLVFVTLSGNMTTNGKQLVMGEHKKKHIGILSKGKTKGVRA